MVAKNATGIPEKVLWYSIYGQIPENVGGTKEREWKPFIFDEKVQKNISDVYAFLLSEKAIKYDKPLPKTVDDSIARKVVKEKNLPSPVAVIIGQPPEKCPFK